MDMLIESVAEHAMFSFMDGFSGYNQIRTSLKDATKAAFRTLIGNFCYTVMPFGLKNAGATYQKAMGVGVLIAQDDWKGADQPIYYVNRMLKDIVAATKPVWCVVRGEFTPRGGLTTTVEARWPHKR